jgi:hypothetical protein
MLNTILLFLIKIVHAIIVGLSILGPFLIKNTFWLLVIIFINIVIVTGWHIYGYCVLTEMENALISKAYKSHTPYSEAIVNIITKNVSFIDKNHVITVIKSLQLISTIVCIVKIYMICSNCRK